jgi:hypothetical protein
MMKPITRVLVAAVLGAVLSAAAFTTGWIATDSEASAQEVTESAEVTTDEPLPDFQPTERLPADSAVAFPTDI